jgi:hypothetical protein
LATVTSRPPPCASQLQHASSRSTRRSTEPSRPNLYGTETASVVTIATTFSSSSQIKGGGKRAVKSGEVAGHAEEEGAIEVRAELPLRPAVLDPEPDAR